MRAIRFPAPARAGVAEASSATSTPSPRSSSRTASATSRSSPVGLAISQRRAKRSSIGWSSGAPTARRLREAGVDSSRELEIIHGCMESATLRRVPQLSNAIQLGLIFGLLLLAAVAWAMTGDRMGGMDAGPGTDLGGLGFWVTAWVVMMAAMMFPSIAPMVLMYARIEEGKREQRPASPGRNDRALRRRLPGDLGRGRPGRLRAHRGCPSARHRFPGLGQRRAVCRRSGDRRCGDLSAHPDEGRLPAALPQPDGLPAHRPGARAGPARSRWVWSTAAGAWAAAGG